jgi:hypothetical protein
VPSSEQRSHPLRGRTVLHLAYADLQARFELITRCLPRLQSPSPRRRWFFVDVPIGATSGLEVVQLHTRTDRSIKADLEGWLESCRTRGLVTVASFADEAMVLDPRFFLDGRIPAFYLTAMADGSARAAGLLDRLGRPASEQHVEDEIAALYAELVPPRAARLRALELYATWLERTADGTVHQATEPAARPDRNVLRASLIARLAHTQAVQLRGPDEVGGLYREARLVRNVLRLESSTRSSTIAKGT